MSIVDSLGSRRRLATAMTALLRDGDIRALADEFRLSVPGFRIGNGPIALIARRIASACEGDPRIRRAVDRRLGRLAGKEPRPPKPEQLTDLSTLAASDARAILASALTDSRAEIVQTAVGLVDEIEAGRLRLEAARTRSSERPPATHGRTPRPGTGRPKPPARAGAAKPGESTTGETTPGDSQLDVLRKEAARQEAVATRLREQLTKSRRAGAEMERKLRTLEHGGKRTTTTDERALHDARKRLEAREREILTLRAEIESARVDLGALIEGARALEALLADPSRTPGEEAIRPTRPRTTSQVAPERKIRIPTSEFWPARLEQALRRLAGDPVVDAVHVIGASSGRSSRVVSDVGTGAFVAQFADGEHAAQLLVLTTADTPSTHAWARRHLATEYFAEP